jgi:hypothetical protein
MSCLVQGGNQPVLVNISNNATDRRLSGRINNCELLSKVAEYRSKQAKCIRHDEVYPLLVQIIANYKLVFDWSIGKDNNLILVELREVCGKTASVSLRDNACPKPFLP